MPGEESAQDMTRLVPVPFSNGGRWTQAKQRCYKPQKVMVKATNCSPKMEIEVMQLKSQHVQK